MARHWNVHCYALSFHFRVDFCDSFRSDLSLEVVLRSAILKCKQALAHRVTVAHATIVNKGQLGVAPAEQVPGDLAAKRSRSKQKALGFLENLQVEIRRLPPLHELEVQTDGLLGQVARIHITFQLDHFALNLTLADGFQWDDKLLAVLHFLDFPVPQD